MAESKPILIIESPYYADVARFLHQGATEYLRESGYKWDEVTVPGALEIPLAIAFAIQTGRFGGYIALGCVIRGETSHYDIVAGESAKALMQLQLKHHVAIGNGILTTENKAQALHRADPSTLNKGKWAAYACLELVSLKQRFGV